MKFTDEEIDNAIVETINKLMEDFKKANVTDDVMAGFSFGMQNTLVLTEFKKILVNKKASQKD